MSAVFKPLWVSLLIVALLGAGSAPIAPAHASDPDPATSGYAGYHDDDDHDDDYDDDYVDGDDVEDESGAPAPVSCIDRNPATIDFTIDVTDSPATEPEPAPGMYAAPVEDPTVLVAVAHGHTHTIESWRHHAEQLAADLGVIVVVMEYRGLARRDPVEYHTGTTMPKADGWPVRKGANDLIAATRLFQERCPTIETSVLFGVSMGANVSGYALAELGELGAGVYDYWVAVEGVHDLLETYSHAKALAAPGDVQAEMQGSPRPPSAAWDIERETGGTPGTRPLAYAERTNLLRTADVQAANLQRVIYVHALWDGTIPHWQSRQMAEQLDVPFEFYSVMRKGDGEPGTTPLTRVGLGEIEQLAGHASERSSTHVVMLAAFDRLAQLVAGAAVDCGEYLVDADTIGPDGSPRVTELATRPCTL